MRPRTTVGFGACLVLAGCSLFDHGGGTPPPPAPASAPQTSAPGTATPSAPPAAPKPAPAPPTANAPSPKTASSATSPAKSPPKKTSTPPPKPAATAGTPAPSQSPKPAAAGGTPPAAGTSSAQSASGAASAAPALDLSALEQRLRDTKAIGVFTKLSLKNQVDDLLAQFKAFHNKQAKLTQSELRQRYDLLLLKVLSLLQDNDPSLASAISASREALWGILIDPAKFAKLS
jgi:hypothetical protein